MKQEIRFLDCIERDLKSRKKKSIKLGIVSAISFLSGVIVIPCCIKNVAMDLNKLWFIIIISSLIAWVPAIFSIPHILSYLRRRENKKDWELITKKYNFNEEITLTLFQISCYTRLHGTSILGGLINTVLPSFGIKMIITQSKEAENEVEIIYILPDNKTVIEKFLCFDNQKVQELETLLRTC